MMNRQMNNNNYQMNERMNRQTRSESGRGGCHDTFKMLRALDFAIQETVLYLDAYPENMQALEYYHQLLEQRNQTMASYQKNCGPLSMYGNVSRNSWDWIRGPWPWEIDAN